MNTAFALHEIRSYWTLMAQLNAARLAGDDREQRLLVAELECTRLHTENPRLRIALAWTADAVADVSRLDHDNDNRR